VIDALLKMPAAQPQSNGFTTLQHVREARSALAKNGHLLIEGAYNRATCNDIIRWIDSYSLRDGVEQNYAGTELRIWDSQKRHDLLRAFWEESNLFMSCLLNADTEAYTLLAIRNRALDPLDTKSQHGRWHIDSLRRQYKIFLFLGDVDESSGPFEFVPGSHAAAFKTSMAIKGIYLRPSDVFSGRRRYSSLDDEWVRKIARKDRAPLPVLCPAGTVMVADTSAIHRARPCSQGARYALTAYYR
jgi:hypothetical protein